MLLPNRANSRDERANALWGRGGRETRANALWGGRGGRGAFVATVAIVAALMLSAVAAAGTKGGHGFWGFNTRGLGRTTAYIPDSLASAIQQNPRQTFDVIVEGVQRPQDSSQTRVNANGLRTGLLGSRRGTDTIGTTQISRTYRAIDGLHASLSGRQIIFMARLPYVAAIVPNDTVQMSGVALPLSNTQKWAWSTGAPIDWNTQATALHTPTIAIVDSGIDANRADFGNRVLDQINLTSTGPNSPGDGYGHGTFVAGIAAGAADGFAGVSPSSNLLSLDVMNDQGEATVADVVAACDWILQNKTAYNIRVANFSLHAASGASLFFDPLDQAVEKLWLNGVVVVAASGNYAVDGQESGVPYAPGNDPFVITVGASDIMNTLPTSDDVAAPWSAWGYTPDGFMKPDISAPGRYVIGPVPAGGFLAAERPDHVVAPGYMQLSGTSFSAPMVAGAAALLLGQHPDWTPDQVKGALMVSADPTPAAVPGSLGVGELDIAAARAVQSPPNPNAALDQYLTTGADGTVTFDNSAWQTAATSDVAWSDAAWSSAAWASAAWSDTAWSDAAWASAAWASAAWSDAAWSDAAWSDAAWSDAAWSDAASGDLSIMADATPVTSDEMAQVEASLGIVDPACDPILSVCTAPPPPGSGPGWGGGHQQGWGSTP
ncbi:MAG TPA: S8 family serine peptidase [Gaiellaceae bacterium]